MAVKCWADCLGDCCGKQSHEHYISEAFFEATTVRIQGFPWCPDKPMEIGLSAATAQILCEHHNNTLSPVDTGGTKVFHTLKEIYRLQEFRAGLKSRMWNVRRYKADGVMLERWFVKTAINIVCAGNKTAHWLEGGTPAFKPPPSLVHFAFGKRPLPPYIGLFYAHNNGQTIKLNDFLNIGLLMGDDRVAAAVFEFRGLRFIMSLLNQPMAMKPPFLEYLGDDWRETELMYHLGNIRFSLSGQLSQELNIKWPKPHVPYPWPDPALVQR
jgi:hypothetical protein